MAKPVTIKGVRIGSDSLTITFKCKPNIWTGSDEDHVTHYAPLGATMTPQMIQDLFTTALHEVEELS